MAINCYTGLQGSGKSYETVSSVICPALKSGRRIVTNIAGLDEDAIKDFIEDQRIRRDEIGDIVHFAFEDILKDGFFCRTDEKTHEHITGSHVRAGDLVIVDEVWRFWGTGQKLPAQHLEFFRMHRHYTDAAGVSCDLVVITQDVGDLDRKLKAVIESTFQMVKLKAIGRPKNYRVEVYTRANVRRKPQQVIIKKYNPEIFSLYSSYDGKGGKEQVIDKRQNMLRGAMFKFVLPLMLLLGGWGVYAASRVFVPKPAAGLGTSIPSDKNKSSGGVPGGSGNSQITENSAGESEFRIVGVAKYGAGAPVFTIESRVGSKVRTVVLGTVKKWSLDETGYSVSYKGHNIIEGSYEARASEVLGGTSGQHQSILPISPP